MPKKTKTTNNPLEAEVLATEESEAQSKTLNEASANEQVNTDEEAEKGLVVEKGADADQVVSAELAAMHVVEDGEEKPKKAAKKKMVKKSAATRSAKYLAAKAQVEAGKLYKLEEAIELVKKVSMAKFDASVEVHITLSKKKTKVAEAVRGLLNLPHGTGKEKKVVVLDEAMIDKIASTKKIDFDVAIATPVLMPKVAKIARILGPQGKMPDPKAGTVTTDPEKVMAEIRSGRVEYRIDPQGNVHQVVGRVSWETAKLKDNIEVVLGAFNRARLISVSLAPSIGPGVNLDLSGK